MSCSELYLGSCIELKELCTEALKVEAGTLESPADITALKKTMECPFVYMLTPHAGCGCGWDYLETGLEVDNKNKLSITALSQYIGHALLNQPEVKIFSACSQREHLPPSEAISIEISEVIQRLPYLRARYGSDERKLFRVHT